MPQEGEADEGADFGEDTAAPEAGDQPAETSQATAAPTRAMPDYGDVVDGDIEETKPEVKVKTEDGSDPSLAPKRPDAVLISGVQRLNRTHIAEVFESKQLPEFVRLDWIGDEQVIAVFSTDEEAAKVVKSAAEGFRDVEDDGAPGPGLWRAMRGMLDFRHATVADEAPMGFKRQHRGGRQVREFRMWTALTDMDKKILEQEDEMECVRKRAATDLDAEPSAKRARMIRGPESGIDLLDKMMQADKKIFVKEEERGALDELPEIPDRDEEEEEYQDWMRRKAQYGSKLDDRAWFERQERKGKRKGKGKGKRDWQDWGHDDRGGNRNDDDDDSWRPGKKGKGKRSKRDRPGPYDSGSKDSESRKSSGKGSGALGAGVDATADELERRAKRADRFKTKPTEPKTEQV